MNQTQIYNILMDLLNRNITLKEAIEKLANE